MDEKAEKLPKISKKWAEFVENFFLEDVLYNATEAYFRTYPKCKRSTARANGSELLANTDIKKHIEARFAEMQMTKDEIIANSTRRARSSIGIFFKIVEQWLETPLSTYQVVSDRLDVDMTDPENPKVRTLYLCRHLVLDIDKIVDPQYAHLIREFSDSPKSGMSIKLHDPQAAENIILRVLGAFKGESDPLEFVDLSKLTMTQLQRIKKGENVIEVLTSTD